MIAVDTNVLIAFFMEVELTPLAEKIFEIDPYWIVPPIWQDEYANVLCKLSKKTKKGNNELQNHYMNVLANVSHNERVVDKIEVIKTCLDHGLSFYDAQFVWLAKHYQIDLVTEDKEITKKCSAFAFSMKNYIEKFA